MGFLEGCKESVLVGLRFGINDGRKNAYVDGFLFGPIVD